jgi:hypothetical protein
VKAPSVKAPSVKAPSVKAPSKSKMVNIEMPKTANTYLGPKGYTIYKSDLNDAQIQFIKDSPPIANQPRNFMSRDVLVSPTLANQRRPKSRQETTSTSHSSVPCATTNARLWMPM